MPLTTLHFGGFHENQRRPGTENVAAIVGMVTAAELAMRDFESEQEREAQSRDELWAGIREIVPTARRNGSASGTLGKYAEREFPGGGRGDASDRT